MSLTIKERINAKIKEIKENSIKFKDEVILAKDSVQYVEKENSKLMIALGFYSSALKELIKQGHERVGDIDLVAEHFDTHQIVNNLLRFTKDTINNFYSPIETTKKRLETYYKLETLYMFFLNEGVDTLTIKLKQGLFKKKMCLNLNEELTSINKLKKECVT
jgi:hypothetical protein